MDTNHTIATYAGYVNEARKLRQSASGGIATAMSESIIMAGGCVVGVAYDSTFKKAEYIIVDNISDLDKLKGSKYIETDKSNIYHQVRELLNAGRRVLFFGLPCVIAALNISLRDINRENLVTCELICNGPTSEKVHRDYVDHLERKFGSTIVGFSVRYKKRGWTPPYIHAEFANHKIFETPFYSSEYGYAFSVFTRMSCYNCHFRGNDRQGDVMIGDFWGAGKHDAFWNENGVSVVLVHSSNGMDLIDSLQGVTLYETSFERAIAENPNIVNNRDVPVQREAFAQLFERYGLIYAVQHTRSLKSRIKFWIANTMPEPIAPIMKHLYNLLKLIYSKVKITRS